MFIAVGDDTDAAPFAGHEVIAHPDSRELFFLDMNGISVWHDILLPTPEIRRDISVASRFPSISIVSQGWPRRRTTGASRGLHSGLEAQGGRAFRGRQANAMGRGLGRWSVGLRRERKRAPVALRLRQFSRHLERVIPRTPVACCSPALRPDLL